MNEVERRNRELYIKELLNPARLLAGILNIIALYWCVVGWLDGLQFLAGFSAFMGLIFLGTLGMLGYGAITAARRRFFTHKHLESAWRSAEERMVRFRQAVKDLRKEQIADLSEMPTTIERVSDQLYYSLRRADLVLTEIDKSEGRYNAAMLPPPPPIAPASDRTVSELYQIADKNIAEYKRNFAAVISGVQRTEAQAAVFTTTLDNLRLKMLGYRLTGRQPEISKNEFFTALGEAKLQLEAIDKALDELEINPFNEVPIGMATPVREDPPEQIQTGQS
ncbi:MAG: hypothetical protein JST40_14275 [Armatimonadetes bacterium]|nr:hypothetical protein [Armatimonadota bacterium]